MPADDVPEIAAEAEDAGCEAVPADLVELHEVLEWEAAIAELAAAETARGVGADLEHQDDDPDVDDTITGQGVE